MAPDCLDIGAHFGEHAYVTAPLALGMVEAVQRERKVS